MTDASVSDRKIPKENRQVHFVSNEEMQCFLFSHYFFYLQFDI